MSSDIRFISANGARLAYQVYGEGSDKPPAVFVHGYGGRSTGEGYAELLNALAAHFTVYALDLRGHGGSAGEVEGWSLAAVADDVAAVARELRLNDPLYIGHSIGAFTGLFSETRHPGTFAGLCLITTALPDGAVGTSPEAGQFLTAYGRDRNAIFGMFAPMYVHGGVGADDVDSMVLVDPRVHEQFFADYPTVNIVKDIQAIGIPVLMLNGAKDVVASPAAQHAAALTLPNCKEVTFTTEGHMLPRESGALAAREIIAFWASRPSADHRSRETGIGPRP